MSAASSTATAQETKIEVQVQQSGTLHKKTKTTCDVRGNGDSSSHLEILPSIVSAESSPAE